MFRGQPYRCIMHKCVAWFVGNHCAARYLLCVVLSCNGDVSYVQLSAEPSPGGVFNSALGALSEIAPAEHYLRTNVTVPSGQVIGADLT